MRQTREGTSRREKSWRWGVRALGLILILAWIGTYIPTFANLSVVNAGRFNVRGEYCVSLQIQTNGGRGKEVKVTVGDNQITYQTDSRGRIETGYLKIPRGARDVKVELLDKIDQQWPLCCTIPLEEIPERKYERVPSCLDSTPPITRFRVDPGPTHYGWNNSEVTVHLEAEDDKSGPSQICYTLSGVISQEERCISFPPEVTCSMTPVSGASVTFDREKEGITAVSFYAIDGWENREEAREDKVRIDKTDPAITGSRSPGPNEHGWNKENVKVTFDCRDPLSDIAECVGDRTLSSEGKDQSVTGRATDKAGNTSSSTIGNINIDKTRPEISTGTPQGTIGNNNWFISDVTVPFTATDKLSGFTNGKLTMDDSARTSGEGTDRTALIRVSDLADNFAERTVGPFKVDKTPPTITATLKPEPNTDGWNNESVTVEFECTDAVSDVASCTEDQTVTREGEDQPVTGEAEDRAGNSNTKTVRVSIDKTKPEVSLRLSDTSIEQGESISITITASDNLSGIDSVTASDNHLGSISLSRSGDQWTETISPSRSGRIDVRVRDRADNSNTDSKSYTVIELEPPYFNVRSISISPGTSFPEGTRATISATIENTGEKTGTQDINLYIDGDWKDYERITLYPGESETVRFYYTFRYSGTYTIKVSSDDDYEPRTVTVIREEHRPEITDTDVEATQGAGGYWSLTIYIDFYDEDEDVEYALWKYADDDSYRHVDVRDQAYGKTSGTIKLEHVACRPITIYFKLEDEAGLESNRESINGDDYC